MIRYQYNEITTCIGGNDMKKGLTVILILICMFLMLKDGRFSLHAQYRRVDVDDIPKIVEEFSKQPIKIVKTHENKYYYYLLYEKTNKLLEEDLYGTCMFNKVGEKYELIGGSPNISLSYVEQDGFMMKGIKSIAVFGKNDTNSLKSVRFIQNDILSIQDIEEGDYFINSFTITEEDYKKGTTFIDTRVYNEKGVDMTDIPQ